MESVESDQECAQRELLPQSLKEALDLLAPLDPMKEAVNALLLLSAGSVGSIDYSNKESMEVMELMALMLCLKELGADIMGSSGCPVMSAEDFAFKYYCICEANVYFHYLM